LKETGKFWDGFGYDCSFVDGDPATGLMTDWLKEGALEGMIPPPTQPID
jgi:hypothetical protein